jgi:translocation and assembly module TamB
MYLTDGRGRLDVVGGVDWNDGKPQGNLSVVADRMRLVQRQDIVLVVSGKGDLSYDQNGISLLGNLKTLYGNIKYHDEDVPALSDDVIVVGVDDEPDDTGASALHFSNLEFDVDLGDHFRLRGYGVDTRVSGTLKLRARPNQSLSAYGTLTASDGTYRAYGQRLEIQRGLISFVGPINNPTLDILAIRENSEVNAGVTVKGTASRPQVSLYSNPVMSTNETLSWLLFDHGVESIDKSDSAMLFSVVNAMIAGEDGNSVFNQLLGGLVDEVGLSSVRTSDGETTQVVTVNKRLTQDISIGLEKSFNGLQDAIRLSWRFSRSWALITRFGVDDSSMDVKYTIRFN